MLSLPCVSIVNKKCINLSSLITFVPSRPAPPYQAAQYYREGQYDTCSDSWNDFKKCLRAKVARTDEDAEVTITHIRKADTIKLVPVLLLGREVGSRATQVTALDSCRGYIRVQHKTHDLCSLASR